MSGRSVYGLVLAAGQSRRMGRAKQFLDYCGGTILEAVLDAVFESTLDGLVVVGNPQVEEFLRGQLPEQSRVAINDDPASEMLRSAQIGLEAIEAEFSPAAMDGVMVLLGDQPQITGGTITTLAEAYRLPRRPPGILIAKYRGRRGHPTIFAYQLMQETREWSPGERKLSDLADLHPDAVRELAITACPLPIDVNTPEDYERLKDQGGRG